VFPYYLIKKEKHIKQHILKSIVTVFHYSTARSELNFYKFPVLVFLTGNSFSPLAVFQLKIFYIPTSFWSEFYLQTRRVSLKVL